MTLNRAFNELQSLGLAEIIMEGREFILQFDQDKKSLWQKAQDHLRSPVMKRLYFSSLPKQFSIPIAGLSALSHYSMLAEPKNMTYALSSTQYNSVKNAESVELPIQEPDSAEIEIWSYSPQFFSEKGCVDLLSLYLSLRDANDERIESAIEEMMENFQW